jgi:prepilin-type N-terminal cleavage/methylation domain-containing protein
MTFRSTTARLTASTKLWPTARGFTLAELLIVLAIAALIAAGLLGVHQTSLQAHARATALHEAQLGARAGLDRMATELRLIGAWWTDAAGPAILAAGPTSVTFMGDVNGDTVHDGIETTTTAAVPAGTSRLSLTGAMDQIADSFNVYVNPALNDFVAITSGARREVAQVAALDGTTVVLATPLASAYPAASVVRSVERVTYAFDPAKRKLTRSSGGSGADTIVDDVVAVVLEYLDGRHPPAPTTDPPRIREIRVSVTVEASGGARRAVTSRVRLRN